ncbi:hypothetical protein ACWN8P_12705 [Vagococcus salmoninarum]|uniref:Uncharacterized protein n=1 Tax=Vagococcus salmoninarum TaxID=2739 RepID=A0A429ZE56_9ENTE|nr:hypothetical protein [Vagococcus salmoninarum]RST91980.1 hypothetical protein CBF35_13615 [Vagococcus salmoninarum]
MIKMLKKTTWLEWLIKGVALIGLITIAMIVNGMNSTLVNQSVFNKNVWLITMSLTTIIGIILGILKKQTSLLISSIFPLILTMLHLILRVM